MNFLFLTTLLILLFSLVASTSSTSIKTTSTAYHILQSEISSRLNFENQEEKDKRNKTIVVNHTKEAVNDRVTSRAGNRFEFRKGCTGINSMLNLYPLLSSETSDTQKRALKEVFIQLLVELYKNEIPDIEIFGNKILQALYRSKEFSTLEFDTAQDAATFYKIWHRKSKSITQYVTVQERQKLQKIYVPGASKALLTAFLGKEKVEKIRAIEKKNYFAGKKPCRINEKEAKELLSDTQLELSRFVPDNSPVSQKIMTTNNGNVTNLGPRPSALKK